MKQNEQSEDSKNNQVSQHLGSHANPTNPHENGLLLEPLTLWLPLIQSSSGEGGSLLMYLARPPLDLVDCRPVIDLCEFKTDLPWQKTWYTMHIHAPCALVCG